MELYVLLHREWEKIFGALEESEQEKLNMLLSIEADVQIRSNIELLLSFGDCGLCHVLKAIGDQLVLVDGVSSELVWIDAILDQVMTEGQSWFEVYRSGYFTSMKHMFFSSVAYEDLRDTQRDRIVQISKQQVSVSAGHFMMGASVHDYKTFIKAFDHERPRHKVTLTQGISVSIYAVTQALYTSVTGGNPSYFKGASRPVECVSWCDAILFCNRLSALEGLTPCYILPEDRSKGRKWSKEVVWDRQASGYRLLTEAEWEYCAGGGQGYLYSGSHNADEVAWYGFSRCGKKTNGVGQRKPNGFGLYDMSGNVREWVWDTYDKDAYNRGDCTDPVVESTGTERVHRGGGWSENIRRSRVSDRSRNDDSLMGSLIGFRCARTLI